MAHFWNQANALFLKNLVYHEILFILLGVLQSYRNKAKREKRVPVIKDEFPPLLQMHSPQFRAVMTDSMPFTGLPDASCRETASCPATVLITGNNRTLGESVAGKMFTDSSEPNSTTDFQTIAGGIFGTNISYYTEGKLNEVLAGNECLSPILRGSATKIVLDFVAEMPIPGGFGRPDDVSTFLNIVFFTWVILQVFPVVYLDEPSTGLDPASRYTLWTVVKNARNNLKARYGGSYVLAVTTSSDNEVEVENMVKRLCPNANKAYHLSGTQKFELPKHEAKIADVFQLVENAKSRFPIYAWGMADTTLEDVFIKVASSAQSFNEA